jgi:hypothetical protein
MRDAIMRSCSGDVLMSVVRDGPGRREGDTGGDDVAESNLEFIKSVERGARDRDGSLEKLLVTLAKQQEATDARVDASLALQARWKVYAGLIFAAGGVVGSAGVVAAFRYWMP